MPTATLTETTTKIERAWDATKSELSKHNQKLAKMLEACTLTNRQNGTIRILAASEFDARYLNQRAAKMAEHEMAGRLAEDARIEFDPPAEDPDLPADGKVKMMQAYGDNRAAIIKPNSIIVTTRYFWNNWKPLLGGSFSDVVIGARSLCYWNPRTGEMRNHLSTDRDELAAAAGVSIRTVARALKNDLVKRYFIKKRIAYTMTDKGPRNQGLNLWVRMDDPLTPDDQLKYNMDEPEIWKLFPDPQSL